MILRFKLDEVLDLIGHAADSDDHDRTGKEPAVNSDIQPSLWLIKSREMGIYMQSNGFPNNIGPIAPLSIEKELETEEFIEAIPIEQLVKGLRRSEDFKYFRIEVGTDAIKVKLEEEDEETNE